jgi:pimeloyl-ACP methyl ester carboxylesterase
MATFVLVHGAWHGGWCWARVAKLIRDAGHDVHTPTLSGLAERAHLPGTSISLTTHVTDITSLLQWWDLSDVILVGHSYGGAVITGVASRVAGRLRSLVYLDAFVPQDGQAIIDLMSDSGRANLMAAAAINGAWIPPISAAHFEVNDVDRAWVDAQCTPHPIGCFLEATRLTGREAAVARRVYLFATSYRNTPFRPFHDRFRNDPAWHVEQIATGHDAMLDDPRALATLLLNETSLANSRHTLTHTAEPIMDGIS